MYSGPGRMCSPKFAHIRTIFAPHSHHIRFAPHSHTFAPYSHHIRTTFAHIRTHSQSVCRQCFTPTANEERARRRAEARQVTLQEAFGAQPVWPSASAVPPPADRRRALWRMASDSCAGDRTTICQICTRFARFAPHSHRIRTYYIRTIFTRIRAYSRKGHSVFAQIRRYSHTFIPIHTCECAKRAPLDTVVVWEYGMGSRVSRHSVVVIQSSRLPLRTSLRSDCTISSHSRSTLVFAVQPSTRCAFSGFPSSCATSVGR
jgi:hypothetical protein